MVLVPASPTATTTTSTAPVDGRPNDKAQLQPDATSGLNTNTECGDEDRQRQRRPYTALRAGRQHAKRTRESRRAWIHALRRTISELETEQHEIQESGRYKWCNSIAAAAGPRSRSCGAVAAGRVPPLSDATGRLTTAAAAAPLTTCQVTVNGRFVEQQPSAAAAGVSRSTQSATAALELWRSLKQHNNNNNNSNNHRQRADLFDTQVASSASELYYETHPPSTVHRYDDPLGLPMAPFLLLHHERHSKRRQPPPQVQHQPPTTSQLSHHPSGARATSVGVVVPPLDSTTAVAPALTSSASGTQVRRATTAAAGTDELGDRSHNHKTGSWPGSCNHAGRAFPAPKQYRDIPPRTTGRGYGGLDAAAAVCGVLSDQHLLDRVRLSTSLRLRHKLQTTLAHELNACEEGASESDTDTGDSTFDDDDDNNSSNDGQQYSHGANANPSLGEFDGLHNDGDGNGDSHWDSHTAPPPKVVSPRGLAFANFNRQLTAVHNNDGQLAEQEVHELQPKQRRHEQRRQRRRRPPSDESMSSLNSSNSNSSISSKCLSQPPPCDAPTAATASGTSARHDVSVCEMHHQASKQLEEVGHRFVGENDGQPSNRSAENLAVDGFVSDDDSRTARERDGRSRTAATAAAVAGNVRDEGVNDGGPSADPAANTSSRGPHAPACADEVMSRHRRSAMSSSASLQSLEAVLLNTPPCGSSVASSPATFQPSPASQHDHLGSIAPVNERRQQHHLQRQQQQRRREVGDDEDGEEEEDHASLEEGSSSNDRGRVTRVHVSPSGSMEIVMTARSSSVGAMLLLSDDEDEDDFVRSRASALLLLAGGGGGHHRQTAVNNINNNRASVQAAAAAVAASAASRVANQKRDVRSPRRRAPRRWTGGGEEGEIAMAADVDARNEQGGHHNADGARSGAGAGAVSWSANYEDTRAYNGGRGIALGDMVYYAADGQVQQQQQQQQDQDQDQDEADCEEDFEWLHAQAQRALEDTTYESEGAASGLRGGSSWQGWTAMRHDDDDSDSGGGAGHDDDNDDDSDAALAALEAQVHAQHCAMLANGLLT